MKKVNVLLIITFISANFIFGQSATISLPDLAEQPAGAVLFPITLEKIDNGMSTFQFFMQYDTLVMTPVNVTYPNKDFPHYEWMNNLNYGPGIILFTWLNKMARNIDPTPGEVMCVIEFTYMGEEHYSPLNWVTKDTKNPKKEMTTIWNEKGEKFTLKLTDGSVGVLP
jgi:hypothetical protein